MKKLANLAAAVALGIGTFGPARADDAAPPKTRAEVTAELDAARASGELGAMTGEDSGSFHRSRQPFTSALSRAQVLAELAAARRSGELAAMTGEDSGSAYAALHPAASTVTRAQVVAELLRARTSGERDALVGEDSGSALLSRAYARQVIRYAGPDIGQDAPEQLLRVLANAG
ncbi:MAG: DUF4148 domain-containing protein [Rubrivivax sp.]|nr:DUF4148 domain-containing protein [Rubrivivax sp.]